MSGGREYPTRPIVGVGVVIIRADAVLLIKRAKPPRRGQWSLPGGAQKLGETLAETARREVTEEAGITVAVLGMIDAVDSISRDRQGAVQFHYALFDVAARWTGGEIKAGSDAADICWAPLAGLDPFDLWSETRRIIDQANAAFKF